MARKYTKEELIEMLKSRAEELGRSPKQKEVKQFQTIVKRFGSFNKGLEAAGLTPNKKRRKKYTEAELIEILQQRAEELGRSPKKREIKQFQTIVNHFGTFNKGLEAAGLTPRRRRDYTKEELIEMLKAKANELGRSPKRREVKQVGAITKHFGSFNKALEAAGLKTEERKVYTNEELIEILQKKAQEIGRAPKAEEVKQWNTISKHFGSFNKGLIAAGLTPNIEHSRTRTNPYTKQELIEILQKKAEEIGRVPKQKEVEQRSTIRKRFGSFNKGLEAAGLTPNNKRKNKSLNLKLEMGEKIV